MKDPSMLGQGPRERLANEAYDTIDPDVVPALTEHVRLRDSALDPACGAGHIMRALARKGVITWGTDTAPRGIGARADFFEIDDLPDHTHAIVTNPPYLDALRFIIHAQTLVRDRGGQVCMLLRNEYDCASTRAPLFREGSGFHKKIVLTWRPFWFEKKPGDASPRHNFAWFVWSFDYAGPPLIEYAERRLKEAPHVEGRV